MADTNVAAVETDERCWKCILQDLKCDSKPICQACRDLVGSDTTYILTCRRGKVATDFEGSLQDVVELSDSSWILSSDDASCKITVDYCKLGLDVWIQYGIVDLPRIFEHITSNDGGSTAQGSAVQMFLEQFETVNERWPNFHETLSESFIKIAATHQKFLLRSPLELGEIRDLDHPLITKSPILNALRLFVISHSLANFGHHFPYGWLIDSEVSSDGYALPGGEAKLKPNPDASRPPAILAHIFAIRLEDGVGSLTEHELRQSNDTIAVLLENALESSKALLLTHGPEHWHTVFFTLCILVLALNNLQLEGYTDVFRLFYCKMRDGVEDLAALYLHCSGDLHALYEERIDKDWLETVVGTQAYNSLDDSWGEYLDLNDTWVVNRDEGEVVSNAEDFIMYLDNMTAGFVG
ncbi:hypothetical protein P154DRAFT_575306 [Amniculicola lignicola CBS 123094]|uniref:Uncharacterized protein n=1 Tax=Amniculicola lignicola CBS 123094 TaxID=1392246 RepID=A0A6A5WJN5_9PLEO|nr:hypothetical protein P154DRAFT_575306 [Amniculicola lignicola CBS 123094]